MTGPRQHLDAAEVAGLREVQAHALPVDAPGAWIAAAIELLLAEDAEVSA